MDFHFSCQSDYNSNVIGEWSEVLIEQRDALNRDIVKEVPGRWELVFDNAGKVKIRSSEVSEYTHSYFLEEQILKIDEEKYIVDTLTRSKLILREESVLGSSFDKKRYFERKK